MTAKIPKRERLMNLVSALLASREPVTFREIVGRVIGYDDAAGEEAMEKRFDRDKADLRALGIPIEYLAPEDGTKNGYVIPADQVFQQKVVFSPQEAMVLAIAGRVGAAATGGGALEEALKGALRKLAVDLPGDDPLSGVSDVAVLRATSGDPESLDNVSRLASAVTEGQRVAFSYQSLEAHEPTPREVDPFGLGLFGGAWYLVGYCHRRSSVRVFKVSRMLGKVELLDGRRRVQVPPDFRLEQHLGRDAFSSSSGELAVVVGLVPRDREFSVHFPGITWSDGPNGFGRFQVEMRRAETIVPWVVAEAGRVTILEPQWLRREVSEAAAKCLAQYQEASAIERVAVSAEVFAEEGLA